MMEFKPISYVLVKSVGIDENSCHVRNTIQLLVTKVHLGQVSMILCIQISDMCLFYSVHYLVRIPFY